MSATMVLFRVYPKDGAAVEEVANSISKAMKPTGIQTEDVAFGIKTIKVLFKFDDEKTGSSSIEKSLKDVKGVGEVEVLEESLI